MNFLGNYVFTLCSVMVMFSAIYMIVPSGETKKTLSAVLGVVIALCMVSPFFDYSEGEIDLQIEKSEELVDYDRAQEMEKRTHRALEIRLEQEIQKEIGRNYGVSVKLAADGIIEKVEIENVTENDKKAVSERFGIDSERISDG